MELLNTMISLNLSTARTHLLTSKGTIQTLMPILPLSTMFIVPEENIVQLAHNCWDRLLVESFESVTTNETPSLRPEAKAMFHAGPLIWPSRRKNETLVHRYLVGQKAMNQQILMFLS